MLVLCFVATGAQWDLLQTFAWGRMMVTYSQAMPLTQAVAKTFDGEMCDICRLVASAQKQEQPRSSVPELKLENKLLFFFQAVPRVVVGEPEAVAWTPGSSLTPAEVRWAPPVPPPRGALA